MARLRSLGPAPRRGRWGALIGREAAGFALDTLAGGGLSPAEQRGKVVVLNFWASRRYPACYEEAPVFEPSWRAYRDLGVVAIGIDIQDHDAPARRFIRDFGPSFPMAPDPGGKVAIDYGIPETFFFDRRGYIRVKHVGPLADELFRARVDRLLAESR